MYSLLRKALRQRQLQLACHLRTFNSSCTVCHAKSHYDALGIPPNSTQNDIKAAYYKLSKIYHPDKNQGSESAATKFRQITQAYEVLSNYRLRRLYDKGILHTAGSQFAQSADVYEPEVEDDPETKFYKSRFRRTKVADDMGRTPIYDFDEWSRAHYGKTFDRRREAKLKYNNMQEKKRSDVLAVQSEIVIFGLFFVAAFVYLIFIAESSYDTPKQLAERKQMEAKAREEEAQSEAKTS